MSCSVHIAIETSTACAACYSTWPDEIKKKYRRVQCKRHNWRGKVDSCHTNPEDIPIKEIK